MFLIGILIIGGASLAVVCFIAAAILGIKVDNNPHLMTNRKFMIARTILSVLALIGLVAHMYTLIHTQNVLREYTTPISIAALIIAIICIRWLKLLIPELTDNT